MRNCVLMLLHGRLVSIILYIYIEYKDIDTKVYFVKSALLYEELFTFDILNHEKDMIQDQSFQISSLYVYLVHWRKKYIMSSYTHII